MAGRRSHPRYRVATPWEGFVRVLRAVVIDRSGLNEFVAISPAPGIAGEEMSLDLITGAARHELRVRVVSSQPVIVDDMLRHRIQLALVASNDAPSVSLLAAAAAEREEETV